MATAEDLDSFCRSLAHLLGVQLARMKVGDLIRYKYDDDDTVSASAFRSRFDSEGDLACAEYPVVISVEARQLPDSDETDWMAWREGVARRVYERLRATGRYALLLVDDFQRKMNEEYLPQLP